MINITLIISPSTFKKMSQVQGNVNEDLLIQLIKDVQINYLRPILGKELYNEIINEIETNTVTALNEELIDNYIIPYIIQRGIYEAIPNLSFKFTNINVGKMNSENNESATLEEMIWLRDNVQRQRIVNVKNNLLEFLFDEVNDYPLFEESKYFKDNITKDNKYSIFIPRDKKKCRR